MKSLIIQRVNLLLPAQNMKRHILLLIMLITAHAVSGQNAATPEPTTSFCGNVGNSAGGVIARALVSMRHLTRGSTHTAETGPDGKYCVNGIVAGRYSLTLSHRGFRIASTIVSVTLNSTVAANTTLIEAPDSFGDLEIKIANGTAELRNASARIIDSDGNIITARVNDDGTVSAENLEKGKYTVVLAADGKETRIKDIRIRPNRTTFRTVVLESREQ
jgi:hypothetical protein